MCLDAVAFILFAVGPRHTSRRYVQLTPVVCLDMLDPCLWFQIANDEY